MSCTRTLRAVLEEHGPLPEARVRLIGQRIAESLATMHAVGTLHRGLTPDTVWIGPEDHVELTFPDVHPDADGTGTAYVGSLHAAAPEQLLAGATATDARTDLYALGVVLFECVSGELPFGGPDLRTLIEEKVHGAPRRLREVTPAASPLLDEVVACLLERDRDCRPSCASEVAQVLALGERSIWWRERH